MTIPWKRQLCYANWFHSKSCLFFLPEGFMPCKIWSSLVCFAVDQWCAVSKGWLCLSHLSFPTMDSSPHLLFKGIVLGRHRSFNTFRIIVNKYVWFLCYVKEHNNLIFFFFPRLNGNITNYMEEGSYSVISNNGLINIYACSLPVQVKWDISNVSIRKNLFYSV